MKEKYIKECRSRSNYKFENIYPTEFNGWKIEKFKNQEFANNEFKIIGENEWNKI